MPESDLHIQHRHLLRAFRKGGAERTRAQTISEAQYNQARQAVDQAHASARAAAEAARATTETDAQTLRETELTNADAELKQARQTIYRYMGEISKVEEQARSTLEESGLLSLIEDIHAVKPAIDTSRHAGQELAGAAHDAKNIATKLIPGLVGALVEAQQRARRRQENMGIAMLVAAIAVVLIGLFLYGGWQDRQQTRRFQATATAQTVIAQTTADARKAIVQATSTAEATVAQVTATARAVATSTAAVVQATTDSRMAKTATAETARAEAAAASHASLPSSGMPPVLDGEWQLDVGVTRSLDRNGNIFDTNARYLITVQLSENQDDNTFVGDFVRASGNACREAVISGKRLDNSVSWTVHYTGYCCHDAKIFYEGTLSNENQRITGTSNPVGRPSGTCQLWWGNFEATKQE